MRKNGIAIPDELVEPEAVFDDLLPVWNAWHDLSVSRPAGLSAGGVPWLEMSRYCEDHGIEGPVRLRWIRLMRAMDLVFLMAQVETKAKRAAKEDGHGSA